MEQYHNPLNLSSNQKLIALFGGLGNQLYIYAFMRWMQERTRETYLFDDSGLYLAQKMPLEIQNAYRRTRNWTLDIMPNYDRGCELETIFGLDLPLMSKRFDRDVWENMVTTYARENRSMPQIFLDYGYPLTVLAEKVTFDFAPKPILATGYVTPGITKGADFYGNVVMLPRCAYIDSLASTQGMIYYLGNWINLTYANDIRSILLNELKLPEIDDERNKVWANQITQTEESVMLHFRCWEDGNDAEPWEKYQNVVQQVEAQLTNPTYFIIARKPDWVREHAEQLGLADKNTVYIEGNDGINAYRDMQLMSMGKWLFITANSTFCHWACFFRQRTDGNIFSLPM